MKKVTIEYHAFMLDPSRDAPKHYTAGETTINVCDRIAVQIHGEMAEENDNEACAIFNQVADALAKAAGFDFGCWSVILDVEDVAE